MTLIYLCMAASLGYLAGTKRLLRFLLPANPITQAIDAEERAMKERMVQSVLQQMRATTPPAAPPTPPAN